MMVGYPLEFFFKKGLVELSTLKMASDEFYEMKWILWDVDLLGTVKSFELTAILHWYDVNRGNIVFLFYLKAY